MSKKTPIVEASDILSAGGHAGLAKQILAFSDLLIAVESIADTTEFWNSYPKDHPFGKARYALLKIVQSSKKDPQSK